MIEKKKISALFLIISVSQVFVGVLWVTLDRLYSG